MVRRSEGLGWGRRLTHELFFFFALRYFRRLCLEALGAAADWDAELSLCDDVAMDQQKNYQVWHHRQTVIGRLGPREGMGERDFALCDRMLKEDSKNYHVWSYRQWAVVTHDAWERELRFVEECIRSDVRNNSAWNQRFWLGERQRWWESAEIRLGAVSLFFFSKTDPSSPASASGTMP